ncbi:MAG: bacteriohemerythrin [Rhodospirillales bacterium]|jgi:hemerythrin
MASYKWLPEYSTTIRVIDNDHKDLFEAINTFFLAHQRGEGSAQIAATIDCLILYVDEHFKREERYLEQINYPELESHRRAHADFSGMIQMLSKLYSTDPLAINVPKVLAFLSDWLTQHILKIDMKYVPYLSGKKEDSGVSEHHSGAASMKAINVPQDCVELVQEIIEIISANTANKKALQEALRQFNDQSEHSQMERAKKLFCMTS